MKDFQEEDQALFEAIEAYRNGDGDKATFIYESTKKYTYKVVHQEVARYKNQSVLTGDEISVTEDIMQDLYIEFFNKIEKFRNEDPRSIFKWISVVSHRMLSDYVDKNKMEVLQFEKDEDYREDNDIWDSSEINDSDMESNHELLPEAALEDKEFRELILDFVQSLPEAQAQTILLHFRGGMKYQEIADEMGVSLITVKTRMKKAKDSLEEIINKYEKRTGTKLHSVSILPLLWLLYRMAAEETVVPMAVDTAVTGSLVGTSGTVASGVGSAVTTGVTKAISTKVLIGIVSATVVIGGAVVGSQLLDKKPETTIEQGDSEDKELDNESGDDTSSKGDKDTSNTDNETSGSDANNQTQDENNGSDTVTNNNGTGENSNGAESNTGENSNTTGSNTGAGTNTNGDEENSNTTGSNTNNSENDSGNGDSGNESTAAKGTRANPYRIGEKIVVTDDVIENYSTSSGDVYNFEITVTDYTPIAKLYAETEGENAMLYNIVKAKVKITGEGENPGTRGPLILFLETNDGGMGYTGHLYTDEERESVIDVQTNTEYAIGVHLDKQYATQDTVAQFFRITYYTTDGQEHMIYIKLE